VTHEPILSPLHRLPPAQRFLPRAPLHICKNLEGLLVINDETAALKMYMYVTRKGQTAEIVKVLSTKNGTSVRVHPVTGLITVSASALAAAAAAATVATSSPSRLILNGSQKPLDALSSFGGKAQLCYERTQLARVKSDAERMERLLELWR